MRKNRTELIWGIAIIILGIIFSGNALNLWNVDVFFDGWWTLFIIIPGLLSMYRQGINTGSIIVVAIGTILLLETRDVFESINIWKLTIPFIMIIVGISIVASFFKKDKHKDNINSGGFYQKKKIGNYDIDKYPRYSSVFGGGDVKNNSQDLKGLDVNVVFGGFDIDLREAIIKEDIVIEIVCLFGGIDIYLPNNVEVVVASGIPIFGGYSCRKNTSPVGAPKVKINYTVIFGGVEIK